MKATSKHWPLVAMLCATATASYICRVNLSTAGALFMTEYDLTQVDIGKIISAFLAGYALFQIPAGMLADKFGAYRVLTIATLSWTLLTALQAVVGSSWWPASINAALGIFVVFRFVLGATAAPTYPAAAQGVARWVHPAFQGRANGIVISSIGLGSALTPVLVSYVMVHWGWRAGMLASAIPPLGVAIGWLMMKEPSREMEASHHEDLTLPKAHSRIRSVSFYLLTLSYTLQGYVGYIFVTWFYLYLVQERHFGLLSGAWMSSLPWILSIVSIPLGGLISDKLSLGGVGQLWGRRLIPIAGMALSGLFISIGAHTSDAIIAATSLALATAFILSVEGPFWSVMMNISGRQSGTAGGIMNMGSNIGGLISPTLTPMLAARIGWENALHLAAILSLIGAVLWFGIKVYPPNLKN